MLKTRKRLRKFLLIFCIVFILISTPISGFYPVYLYRDNTIYINGIQYKQISSDWLPTGEKYRIGNLCGDVSIFSFLYKYKGDDENFFAYVYTFPSDVERMPYYRVDMPLPSFSADVIDSVNMSMGSDMTPDNMEDKEIAITDKKLIGEIAECFLHPVAKDAAKEAVWTSIGLTAQSSQYESMIYKISAVAYDEKYCFMQEDGSLFEIPIELLEDIFDADITEPELYATQEEATRELTNTMLRCINEYGTFYLFMWREDYVIIEIKGDIPSLKESGLYNINVDRLFLYPDDIKLGTYSYKIDVDDIKLTSPTNMAIYSEWEHDEESSINLEYNGRLCSLLEIAEEYSTEAFSNRTP